MISSLQKEWKVEVEVPFPDPGVNRVAPAKSADGRPAVLKLSFPGDKEFLTGAEALKTFAGRGACRLLRLDRGRGAMLLERCEPGTPLSAEADDARATSSAVGLMRRLWRPAPPEGTFPLVRDWARGFERLRQSAGGGTGPLPEGLVEEAERLFEWLVPTQGEPALLHGDIHHDNILKSAREGWLAVDPKGLVGEPAYDAATLLREPPGLTRKPDLRRVLERRLEQLAVELGMDRARLRGWAAAQAVLAAFWSFEDFGEVWEVSLVFARNLLDLPE